MNSRSKQNFKFFVQVILIVAGMVFAVSQIANFENTSSAAEAVADRVEQADQLADEAW